MAATFRRRLQQAAWVAEKRAAQRTAQEEAQRLHDAWERYVQTGAALAAITACTSTCPDFDADVAPVVCQLLEGHPPGAQDGGHRHRILGSQVVVTW